MGKVSVFESKECKRIQKLLDHFLAGELTVETNQEILLHLEHCSVCQVEEKLRMQARQALTDSWNSQPVPSGLKDKITEGIEAKASTVPALLRRVAGLLLMAVGLGTFVLFFPSLSKNAGLLMAVNHYEEVAADHVNCSGHPVPPTFVLPLESVQSRLEQTLEEMSEHYQLTATRICRIGEVQVIHYVFQGLDRRVSLVLEQRLDQQHLVLEGNEPQRVLHDLTVFLLEMNSITLASFETPDYFVYLVSEKVDAGQVFQLAEKMIPFLKVAL
ncbi:zf-HC2 domain-containing protein [Acidobacteria bacterium AH-259-D05]|nr:zf-HC2 domain-containing protein [Acidobacteria bacterium AH-259-D05]